MGDPRLWFQALLLTNNREEPYFACDGTEGESSAAVTVNNAYAGGFIGAPYRLDITHAVKDGENTLEAKPFRLKNPRIVVVRQKVRNGL